MTPDPTETPPPAPAGAAAYQPQFPTNLPEDDGEPLESAWHRAAINLLVELLWYHLRDRRDFYAGGNMFLYFSEEQVRNKDYRGPDFFFAWNVERDKKRRYWAVWQEGGKYPDLIVELLSPTTAREDRTTKKALYQNVFQTREYFLYDPDDKTLEGYRLIGGNGGYEPIEPERDGRMWSRVLELYLGRWDGEYLDTPDTWLRFFDVRNKLILTAREDKQVQLDQEKRRADDEKRRADEQERRAEEEKRRADEEKLRADLAVEERERLLARIAELENHTGS